MRINSIGTKKIDIRAKLAAAAGGLILSLIPIAAAALTSGGVGGYPAHPDPSVQYSESWFIYKLEAGKSKDDSVLIFNTSDETHTIKLYTVDSIPSNQGNFALKNEDQPREGIGAWITLATSTVTLQPGENREVPFTISIPENADVGEHSGGIMLQKIKPGEVQGTGATIVTRVGIRVYETVPGEIIKKISLVDFSVNFIRPKNETPRYQISLTALNESNVSITPKTTLVVSGWGKIKYFTRSKFHDGFVLDLSDLVDFFSGDTQVREWQLLRGQKVTTRWDWPKPVFGRYTFQATLQYGDDDKPQLLPTPAITIWVIPWLELEILGALILLVALALGAKKLLFGTRRWVRYKVKSGDQLVDLAERAHIGWKKLAKANRLKSPSIRAGQIILVPPSLGVPGEKITDAELRQSKHTRKRNIACPRNMILAGGIVLVGLIITGIVLRPEPTPTANTNVPFGELAGLKPSEITVGIYDPKTETATSTKLLESRLKLAGFQTTIVKELPDATAGNQDTTTVLYRSTTEKALAVVAKEIIASTAYRKGQNDAITTDILFAVWNDKDINWGELAVSAQAPTEPTSAKPEPKDIAIAVLNGGGPAGAAKRLAGLLNAAGYPLTEAANAPAEIDGSLYLTYQDGYQSTVEAIVAMLKGKGYPATQAAAPTTQEKNIIITIGRTYVEVK